MYMRPCSWDNDFVDQKEGQTMKYDMPTIRKMDEFLGRDRDAIMTQELADATCPEWRKAIAAEDDRRFADALKSPPAAPMSSRIRGAAAAGRPVRGRPHTRTIRATSSAIS